MLRNILIFKNFKCKKKEKTLIKSAKKSKYLKSIGPS